MKLGSEKRCNSHDGKFIMTTWNYKDWRLVRRLPEKLNKRTLRIQVLFIYIVHRVERGFPPAILWSRETIKTRDWPSRLPEKLNKRDLRIQFSIFIHSSESWTGAFPCHFVVYSCYEVETWRWVSPQEDNAKNVIGCLVTWLLRNLQTSLYTLIPIKFSISYEAGTWTSNIPGKRKATDNN